MKNLIFRTGKLLQGLEVEREELFAERRTFEWGLVYVSGESSEFMSALKKNLASSKETINQLKRGSQKVVSAVNGNELSGAAYTAGKGLFSELIIPTITRTANAIEKIEQELQRYKVADQIVAMEGYLDENKLNQSNWRRHEL